MDQYQSRQPIRSELDFPGQFLSGCAADPGTSRRRDRLQGLQRHPAAWGTNRLISQQCGQAWQQTFKEAGNFYSSSNQLPAIQIATWNDYEEGTAIEPGIDSCIYLTPSQSGTTINWQVNGGAESTIDHYTVFISSDGANLAKLSDVPNGTHKFDLNSLNLSSGSYLIYVKATGAASFLNKMSPPITYRSRRPASQCLAQFVAKQWIDVCGHFFSFRGKCGPVGDRFWRRYRGQFGVRHPYLCRRGHISRHRYGV